MRSFLTALAISRGPAASFTAMGCVWGSFMAAMPDIKADLGVGDAAFGQLLIWGSVAAIAMMNLAPRFGTAMGRAALPLFTTLMGCALMAQAFSASALSFALALMAMGASTGALDVLMNARVGALEAGRKVPLMNMNHALYSLGFAGAAVLTGGARASGFGVTTILISAALVVILMAALSIERDGRIDGLSRQKGAKRVPLGRVAWLGGVLVMIGLMTENAVEAWSALFIERDLGGATGAGSLGPALLGLTMGIGRLAGQGLSLRISDRSMLRGGFLGTLLGVLVVVAATGPFMAFAGFVVIGLGGSVIVPTVMSLIGRMSSEGLRSAAIARATVIGYAGYFLGPPLLGFAASILGLRASFALIAMALGAGLILLRILMRGAEQA